MKFIVAVFDAGSECCASKLHHRLLFKINQNYHWNLKKKLLQITHPVLYGTFPAPSNVATAIPVLRDAVAEAKALAVGESEVLVACTSACFGLCQDGGFQAPRGKFRKF